MIKWYRKRKLVILVTRLAAYNDKGFEWSKHNDQQIEHERQKLINLIKSQIKKIGEAKVSNTLLAAVETGSLKTDITGMYIQYAKQTKL